jgi:hypothetical protein
VESRHPHQVSALAKGSFWRPLASRCEILRIMQHPEELGDAGPRVLLFPRMVAYTARGLPRGNDSRLAPAEPQDDSLYARRSVALG